MFKRKDSQKELLTLKLWEQKHIRKQKKYNI